MVNILVDIRSRDSLGREVPMCVAIEALGGMSVSRTIYLSFCKMCRQP